MLNIEGTVTDSKTDTDYGPPLIRRGFRPFFLGAGIFAVISMAAWMAVFVLGKPILFTGMNAYQWHAHEMFFGYTMAVVAGFLLTAIQNWTGISVLRGKPLAVLFLLWFLARILPFSHSAVPLELIAGIDVGFMLMLTLICLRPVIKVRQYKQIGIISKLFLLMLCNVVFYLGVFGVLADGVTWGLYSALYIIIGLILVMMRRVMPMFIKNGVDGEVCIRNYSWLDNSSLVLLVCLWLSDVFTAYDQLTAVLAAALTVLHIIRLSGWYTNRIWTKPLVWILVVAYGFIIAGFLLKALSIYIDISPSLSLHSYTVGGIGLVTLGMMSRVSLGHTGRNVFDPPPVLGWIFLAILGAAVLRVIFPLFDMDLYQYWIAVSQILWIIAFAAFSILYAPMFLSGRVDGRDG